MIWLLLALAYAAAAYQILAIVAALSHRKRALAGRGLRFACLNSKTGVRR